MWNAVVLLSVAVAAALLAQRSRGPVDGMAAKSLQQTEYLDRDGSSSGWLLAVLLTLLGWWRCAVLAELPFSRTDGFVAVLMATFWLCGWGVSKGDETA